jgi:catechol 2,3-dioxygenase-like lactoylglutathione lyase family enzyme
VLSNGELVAFLATSDLDRARRFFTEVVGLDLVEHDGFACVLDANGTTVRVTLVDEVRVAPYTVLGWLVSDIAASARGLAARGVPLERFEGMAQDELGVWTTPGGDLVAWFKDPDGNVLSLTQLVARDAVALPAAISVYQHAHDRRETSVALSVFAPDARVVDDGREFRGLDEIGEWLATAASEFTFTRTLVSAEPDGAGAWLVVNHLEGDFPGGEVDLRYRFVLDGDLITELVIAP